MRRQTDLTFFHPREWYVPIADWVKIYAMLNITVQWTDIYECQLLFTAGAEAIKYLSWVEFIKETGPAPWMVRVIARVICCEKHYVCLLCR